MTKYVARGDALEPAYVNNMVVASMGWGIIDGFVVSENSSGANLSVDISAGTAFINSGFVSVYDKTDRSITAPTADRYDLIVLNSSGTISVIPGAYNTPPYANDYDFVGNNAILLAIVYLPSGDTAITDSQITNMSIALPDFATLTQAYYNALFEKQASDDLQLSNDDAEYSAAAGYSGIKVFTISVPFTGTLRVKFDLATMTAGFAAYGKVYLNTSAVGTEQSTTLETYTTFSEDIAFGSVSMGDIIELYVYGAAGSGGVMVRNFRLYCSNSTTLTDTTVLYGMES